MGGSSAWGTKGDPGTGEGFLFSLGQGGRNKRKVEEKDKWTGITHFLFFIIFNGGKGLDLNSQKITAVRLRRRS